MPNQCALPGLAVSQRATHEPRLGAQSPRVRPGRRPSLRILFLRPAGHTHCWLAGTVLHDYANAKSTYCSAVRDNVYEDVDVSSSLYIVCSLLFVFECSLVMAVAMAYLSAVHLYRLYYDYGSTTIDITGPLMMITQKVTTLAFSLHDGMHRDASTLSATQRVEAVRRVPSPLEYFAYCLHFQSLMAGPIVLFGEYQAFVDGSNWRRAPNAATGGRAEPSPMRTVVQKMLGSTLCAFVFMKFGQVYPVRSIKDGAFVGAHSSAGKLWYVMNATMFVRFKYYHAWLMGDAICNNSGLGFNGYDARGQAKWDLCSNIDILGFEVSVDRAGHLTGVIGLPQLTKLLYIRTSSRRISETASTAGIWLRIAGCETWSTIVYRTDTARF